MSWLEVINIFNDWNKCATFDAQKSLWAKSFVFILQGMDGRAQNVLPISCMEEIVSGESLCEKVYINKHNWINWIVMMSWVETFSLKQMCSIMLRMSYKVSLGQRSFVFILQDGWQSTGLHSDVGRVYMYITRQLLSYLVAAKSDWRISLWKGILWYNRVWLKLKLLS